MSRSSNRRRRALSPSLPRDEMEAARLRAAAVLELARAQHHLSRTLSGTRRALRLPGEKVGAAARSAEVLDSIIAHSRFTHVPHSEVKGMSSDLPPELASYSDGVTDDAAYQPEIIGCASDPVGCELTALEVAGFPSYLLTRRGLSNATVRRRLGVALRAMTPKMRRRVMARLRQAAHARPSVGATVRAYPTVAGYSGGYPSIAGWQGVSVGKGRCPYAGVAGALTP